MKDLLINETFRVDYKIAFGGQAVVYAGTDIRTNEQVAIKLGHAGHGWVAVEDEGQIYAEIAGAPGVPRILHAADECSYYVLVQELLGPTLGELLQYCGGRFSLKTALLVADQAVARLQHVHGRGFVHQDVKPENLLMGSGANGSTLYVVDYGLATRRTGTETQEKRDPGTFLGTVTYAPINSHRGLDHSWGDDLETLGYVLVYLLKGSLPWGGTTLALGEDDPRGLGRATVIGKMKESMTPEEICADLPREFATFLEYARSLEFGAKPNYAYLRRLFRRLFARKRFRYDHVYDWTEKRFREMQEEMQEQHYD